MNSDVVGGGGILFVPRVEASSAVKLANWAGGRVEGLARDSTPSTSNYKSLHRRAVVHDEKRKLSPTFLPQGAHYISLLLFTHLSRTAGTYVTEPGIKSPD